jgi:phosphatidate cytidylyltransferase
MQSEYNSMVKATGVSTTFRLSVFVSALCFVTAAVSPWLHELILPTYVSVLMLTLLGGNGRSTNIREIATSILGVVYAGYLPSFWVRLRALNDPNFLLADPTRAIWTMGAAVTWWTWTSIVFSGSRSIRPFHHHFRSSAEQ